MVSTRQMSIVNSGAPESSGCTAGSVASGPSTYSGSSSNAGTDSPGASGGLVGPARFTRNAGCSGEGGSLPRQQQQQQQRVGVPTAARSLMLLDLPQELVEKILTYLPFRKICNTRLVCREMDRICGNILNLTFSRLQTQMFNKFQDIKSKMPRRESARRNHHLACESDIIETLHMRLTLLQMTFGKHIERRHCCFFPGDILDEVFNILHYVKITNKLQRPYKVTDELFDLSTMAMEYFKEKIEPDLPEIAYFSSEFLDFATNSYTGRNSKNKFLAIDSSPLGADMNTGHTSDDPDMGSEPSTSTVMQMSVVSTPPPAPAPTPQANMVLRKRIRKIKQGMKRYNSQLTTLSHDLRTCKRKIGEQQRQITEHQKQLAEQIKQTLEYATRLDENDKKNDEMSRKFSTLLQELNKCKTELQYWRSKSPATPPFCNGCGNVIETPPEELRALLNQGILPEALEDVLPNNEDSYSEDLHDKAAKTISFPSTSTVNANTTAPSDKASNGNSGASDSCSNCGTVGNVADISECEHGAGAGPPITATPLSASAGTSSSLYAAGTAMDGSTVAAATDTAAMTASAVDSHDEDAGDSDGAAATKCAAPLCSGKRKLDLDMVTPTTSALGNKKTRRSKRVKL